MNLADVVSTATGSYYSFAIKSDGTGWSWGNNSAGQLGAGLPFGSISSLPVAVVGGAQF
jgi:alpha-tubulin suppressor-like RCC1 family protein